VCLNLTRASDKKFSNADGPPLRPLVDTIQRAVN
jgi:hypothetical protein